MMLKNVYCKWLDKIRAFRLPMKVVIPRPNWPKLKLGAPHKILLALALLGGVGGTAFFSYYWHRYALLINRKLSAGPFNTPSKIFAAPEPVYVGEQTTSAQIVSYLLGAGYSVASSNPNGW